MDAAGERVAEFYAEGGDDSCIAPETIRPEVRNPSPRWCSSADHDQEGYTGTMSSPARRLATYADLAELGEAAFHEVLGGELIEKAAPLPEHGLAQRALGRFIGGPFHDDDGRGGPGGWWILTEVEVELETHEVVRPDVVGWRRERLRAPWGQRPVVVIPDWICEVLSPSDEGRDRVKKAALYARSGVSYYWMLAPGERFLEAFELRAGAWMRLGAWQDTERARIPPFEVIELDLERLFAPRDG